MTWMASSSSSLSEKHPESSKKTERSLTSVVFVYLINKWKRKIKASICFFSIIRLSGQQCCCLWRGFFFSFASLFITLSSNKRLRQMPTFWGTKLSKTAESIPVWLTKMAVIEAFVSDSGEHTPAVLFTSWLKWHSLKNRVGVLVMLGDPELWVICATLVGRSTARRGVRMPDSPPSVAY